MSLVETCMWVWVAPLHSSINEGVKNVRDIKDMIFDVPDISYFIHIFSEIILFHVLQFLNKWTKFEDTAMEARLRH